MTCTKYIYYSKSSFDNLPDTDIRYIYESLLKGNRFMLKIPYTFRHNDGKFKNIEFDNYNYYDYKFKYFLLTNDERRRLVKIFKEIYSSCDKPSIGINNNLTLNNSDQDYIKLIGLKMTDTYGKMWTILDSIKDGDNIYVLSSMECVCKIKDLKFNVVDRLEDYYRNFDYIDLIDKRDAETCKGSIQSSIERMFPQMKKIYLVTPNRIISSFKVYDIADALVSARIYMIHYYLGGNQFLSRYSD